MKIEVGESLCLSWLRHEKGCQLVQTNWKPSINSWGILNEDEVKRLMNRSSEYFRSRYGIEIFKKNTSHRQLLQQAEIDVLGTAMNEKEQKFYAIDVAFHEQGLNYGSKEETAKRVVKKIIRTAMCYRAFLNTKKGEILFASPKINKSTMNILVPFMNDIRKIFKDFNYEMGIDLIANGDFKNMVFDPVIKDSTDVADTSELFLRSIQLHNIFASNDKLTSSRRSIIRTEQSIVRDVYSDIKIGALVKSKMVKLLKENQIAVDEIERMTTKEYSKQVFNMGIPVLKEVDEERPISEQRIDDRGYGRYWNFTVLSQGKQYLISSQWYEKQNREEFISWFEDRTHSVKDYSCHD